MAASLIAGLMQHKSKEATTAPVHTSALLEQMPDPETCILSGRLLKCPFFSSGSNWRPIWVVITEEQLCMSKAQSDTNCIDKIHLHEVLSIDSSEMKIKDQGIEYMAFDIMTEPDGHNQGRKYTFRCPPEMHAKWVNDLTTTCAAAKELYDLKQRKTIGQKIEISSKQLHDSDHFQQFFGVVIMTSFVISLVQTEMMPVEGSSSDDIFRYLDYIFTSLFTVELFVTILGHFGLVFFMDAWRIFDTVIVAISLVAASGLKMPAVKSIRAMRVLRAVRLLKKSKSLRPIVEALFASVIPVANSMVLLALVTAIYASMGVGLFAESNPILFGRLSLAMFTMFQTCTGDGWATDVVREMADEKSIVQPLPVIFFVSYMLVAALVLINIIIAVLLDEFLTTMSKSRQQFNKEEVEEQAELTGHCLDPLMSVLSKYRGASDLIESIHLIYMRLDEDGSGQLGMTEVRDGLPKIIPIELSVDDWYHITEDVLKLREMTTGDTEDKEIDPLDLELSESDFQLMCLSQLKSYLLRESNKALAGDNNANEAMLMILKWVMVTLDQTSKQGPKSNAESVSGNPAVLLDPLMMIQSGSGTRQRYAHPDDAYGIAAAYDDVLASSKTSKVMDKSVDKSMEGKKGKRGEGDVNGEKRIQMATGKNREMERTDPPSEPMNTLSYSRRKAGWRSGEPASRTHIKHLDHGALSSDEGEMNMDDVNLHMVVTGQGFGLESSEMAVRDALHKQDRTTSGHSSFAAAGHRGCSARGEADADAMEAQDAAVGQGAPNNDARASRMQAIGAKASPGMVGDACGMQEMQAQMQQSMQLLLDGMKRLEQVQEMQEHSLLHLHSSVETITCQNAQLVRRLDAIHTPNL